MTIYIHCDNPFCGNKVNEEFETILNHSGRVIRGMYVLEAGPSRHHFCSRACIAKWIKEVA